MAVTTPQMKIFHQSVHKKSFNVYTMYNDYGGYNTSMKVLYQHFKYFVVSGTYSNVSYETL